MPSSGIPVFLFPWREVCMPAIEAQVVLELGTQRLQARFSVPEEPIAPVDLLPIARAIVERITQTAIADLPAGKEVTCKAGCGACCRQLVPISQTEARMLAFLVRDMPEPRRSIIADRFRAAEKKLREAGLWDVLTDRANWVPDDVRRRGLEYFHLGIPCPFLEDEACSIHPDRPLSCREYLVTSDPVHCAAVRGEAIEQIPLPLKASAAMNRMAPMREGAIFYSWVPLVQIFDWIADNPDPPAEKPGPELVREFFEKLTSKPKSAE
jgi:Fe-S-cluster containining protein